MEHISIKRMIAIIEGQGDMEAEAHISVCGGCHSSYAALIAVAGAIGRAVPSGETTPACPEDWQLGAFMKGETPADEAGDIAGHMGGCPYCTDRAAVLYSALEAGDAFVEAPRLWKRRALRQMAGDSAQASAAPSLIRKAFLFLKGLAGDLPPLPGYALAAAATLVLMFVIVSSRGQRVIVVASSETVTTRDSEVPSSLGFTGAGQTMEVEGMHIGDGDGDLVFRWQDIGQASAREFRVLDRASGKVVFIAVPEGDRQVSVRRGLLREGRLYSWLIRGESADGKYVEYMGDFLLAR